MSRTIYILASVALTFSLAISASPKKEGMTKMMDSLSGKATEEAVKMFVDTLRECNETFTIEQPYLQSLNESGTFPDETDRKPKCYVRCILEKTGVATEDGVYDPDMMRMLLSMIRPASDSSNFGEITVMCNDRKEPCKCERAYQYAKCVLQEEMKKNSS